MLRKSAVYEVGITDYTADGMGVAHAEGCAVFIPNAVAGERLRISIVHAGKNKAIGRIEGFGCLERAEECFLRPEERKGDFRPISAGICDSAIRGEAERCLQCDLRFTITGHRLWSDYSADKEAAK